MSENDQIAILQEDNEEDNEIIIPANEEEIRISLDNPDFFVLKRRWYILFLFSYLGCLQCWVWNTYGPIDEALLFAYPNKWHDSTTAFMANWGCIVFVLGFFPLTYLTESRGLRFAVVIATALTAAGTALRAVSGEETYFLITSHICSILNGATGIAVLSVPAAISAAWFPPSERATATSISQIAGQLGNGLTFLVGPYVVPYSVPSRNSTFLVGPYVVPYMVPRRNTTLLGPSPTEYEVRQDLHVYMVALAVAASVFFLAVLIYFPSKPHIPPSPSGLVTRTNFKNGITALATNRNSILIILSSGIFSGVYGTYSAVMTINFRSLGVSDDECGKIGVIGVFISTVAAFFVAFLTDKLETKRMKLTLILLLIVNTGFNIWLTLICMQWISFEKYQFFFVVISCIVVSFATAPLYFEYAVELAYPVSEGLVGGSLSVLNNIVGFLFLCVFFTPIKSVIWMNYTLVLSSIIAIPLVFFTKETYRRLAVDQLNQTSQNYQQIREEEE